MRAINCAQCGKHLFDTDKSNGEALIEARNRGYVGKMPFLYGIVGCFFFCNKDCNKKWSDANIPEEARAKGNKAIADLRAQIPQMVEASSKVISAMERAINKAVNNG